MLLAPLPLFLGEIRAQVSQGRVYPHSYEDKELRAESRHTFPQAGRCPLCSGSGPPQLGVWHVQIFGTYELYRRFLQHCVSRAKHDLLEEFGSLDREK